MIGRCGLLPRPNRVMVVFNGVPYRWYVLETQSELPYPWTGQSDSIRQAGEFGVSYRDRIEWIGARHVWAEWSVRPSGRPLLTLWGVKYQRRVEYQRESGHAAYSYQA